MCVSFHLFGQVDSGLMSIKQLPTVQMQLDRAQTCWFSPFQVYFVEVLNQTRYVLRAPFTKVSGSVQWFSRANLKCFRSWQSLSTPLANFQLLAVLHWSCTATRMELAETFKGGVEA